MLHCGVVAGTKPTLHLSLVEDRTRYSAVSAVLVSCPSPLNWWLRDLASSVSIAKRMLIRELSGFGY